MRRANWIVCGLVITGGFVGSAYWARGSTLPNRVRQADSSRRGPELDYPNRESSSGSSEEVQRLRAELRKKDALLDALVSAQKAAADRPAPSMPVAQPEPLDPVARAIDTLDERMLMGPKDPRKIAEMERALKDAVSSSVLGDVKVASMYCGGSNLCKVALSGASDKAVDESISTLSGHLPKTFGASTVLRLSDGQSAIYLAKSSDDLNLEPEKEAKP
jgi:hypothetical protein